MEFVVNLRKSVEEWGWDIPPDVWANDYHPELHTKVKGSKETEVTTNNVAKKSVVSPVG